ncbi:hypothetical protein [Serinicoccus sp. LYQ131]|uniref:hypothetical protein n=1 Tax=Serinicoccus sp. LYQ131 TaxID=3378797 RepID=UPI003852EAFC
MNTEAANESRIDEGLEKIADNAARRIEDKRNATEKLMRLRDEQDEAQAEQASLKTRLERGDEDVSTEDLMRSNARVERANSLEKSWTMKEQKIRDRALPSPVAAGVVATILAERFPRAAWSVDMSLRTPKDTDAPLAGVVAPVPPKSTYAVNAVKGCAYQGDVDILIEATDELYRVPSSEKIIEALNASPHVIWCDAGVTGGGSDDSIDIQLSVMAVQEDIPTFNPKPANGWNRRTHELGPKWVEDVHQYVSIAPAVRDSGGSIAYTPASGDGMYLYKPLPGHDDVEGSSIDMSTPDAEGVVTITRKTRYSVVSGNGGHTYGSIVGRAQIEAEKHIGGYNPYFGKIEDIEFHQHAHSGATVTIVETFLHRPLKSNAA